MTANGGLTSGTSFDPSDTSRIPVNTAFTRPWTNPVVGYLTFDPTKTLWVSIAGWMDLGEFDYYYKILQSEQPVHFYYQRQDTSEFKTGYLTKLGIGTGTEVVGEGPTDPIMKMVHLTTDLQRLIGRAGKKKE